MYEVVKEIDKSSTTSFSSPYPDLFVVARTLLFSMNNIWKALPDETLNELN